MFKKGLDKTFLTQISLQLKLIGPMKKTHMNGKYFENKFQIPYMSSFITKTHFNLILQSPAPIIQIQRELHLT